MRIHFAIPTALVFAAACGGGTSDSETPRPNDAGQGEDASLDVPADRSAWDGVIVLDPPVADGLTPLSDLAIIAPDGRVSWPRSDGAAETPDADTWDAGQGCPHAVPAQGEPCAIGTSCAYPIDCCGILAGFFRTFCQNGTWTVIVNRSGEECAPCIPFPQEGAFCSLDTTCQSGPPPICLRPTCYGGTDVARCAGGRWRITPGCIK
jgi:hypothetical protein